MPEKLDLQNIKNHILSLGIVVSEESDELLLLQTFTHKSFSADAPEEKILYNERLEFLGDSVLGCVVAAYLYENYPEMSESKLTLSKIYLVKESTLATAARKIELGTYIRLGRGEERSGGRDKDAVLSDMMEALIAYVYLACGREEAKTFIAQYLVGELEHISSSLGKSRKSQLQEFVQKLHKDVPSYEEFVLEEEASGNVLSYGSKISIQGELIAQGSGSSKKRAQEDAAEKAYHIYTSSFVGGEAPGLS